MTEREIVKRIKAFLIASYRVQFNNPNYYHDPKGKSEHLCPECDKAIRKENKDYLEDSIRDVKEIKTLGQLVYLLNDHNWISSYKLPDNQHEQLVNMFKSLTK